jgi:arabinosaccharide transport system substrate-binding protein
MKRILFFVLVLIAGSGLVFAGGTQGAGASAGSNDVVLWAFADTHARYFEWAGAEYKKAHPDFNLRVELGGNQNDRMTVVIMANGAESPDLVDVEQGTFPRYMTAEMMCFEPLNKWIERDGIHDKVVESRDNLYRYNGNYYGIEHALTPVTMAYRPDLFQQYNIKVPTTWAEYMDAAAKFKQYGIYIACAGDMRSGVPGDIETLLKGANLDLVDKNGQLNMSSAYRQLLTDFKSLQQQGMNYIYETDEEHWVPFRENKVATYITPDWAAGWLRDNVPEQSGKWAMAPLVKYNNEASRTSCSGGTGLTMMTYTKKDKEMLWDFIKFAQVNTQNAVQKYKMINLFPVVYEAMPLCGGPVEYFGGQDLGALYQELAREMPVQNQAPWRSTFGTAMGTNAYDFYEGNLSLEEYIRLGVEAVQNYQSN